MKRLNVLTSLLATVALLGAATVGHGQGKLSLEQKIERALVSNPEILMAEAKVQQAQAEYRIARLRVTQQVLQSHGDYQTQVRLLEANERNLERARLEEQQGLRSATEVGELEMEVIQVENRLAQLRAQEHYILGADTAPEPGPGAARAPVERDPLPTAFLDDLELVVRLDAEETSVREMLALFSSALAESGLAERMILVVDDEWISGEFDIDEAITIPSGTVQLRHALLMLADKTRVRFVFRDYGLLATTEERAAYLSGASIPAGLPLEGD